MWTSVHGWTHIVSDVAIWAAYTAIPIVLFASIRRRDDIPFLKVFWLFGAFILACGVTHLVEATIFWQPWYRLSALLKATTAVVSWMTVGALIRVMPGALQLPGMMRQNEKQTAEIEQRKAAEARLRESERRLRAVVEELPVLLGAFDDQGQVGFWNAESTKVTGYAFEELEAVDDPLGLLYPDPDFRAQMTAEWESRGTSFRDWEIPVVCRDQSVRTIAWSNLSGVEALPGWTSWAMGVDVTDRVAAEEKLVGTAANLARSNADLERFAASASHDLRAPLRGIRSLAEWVL
ncbi:MAG: PAS domain S-box-containing protein [Bradymonadia bacterium]|jgi:PAS domain S-box-containing protein